MIACWLRYSRWLFSLSNEGVEDGFAVAISAAARYDTTIIESIYTAVNAQPTYQLNWGGGSRSFGDKCRFRTEIGCRRCRR